VCESDCACDSDREFELVSESEGEGGGEGEGEGDMSFYEVFKDDVNTSCSMSRTQRVNSQCHVYMCGYECEWECECECERDMFFDEASH